MNKAKLKGVLVEHFLAGKLNRNHPESNRQAIREMLAWNSYWTFDAYDIGQYDMTYSRMAAIMAAAIGLSEKRFASNHPVYIDPELTANGLIEMRLRLEALASNRKKVLFATAHPGSLAGFYQVLASNYAAIGGNVAKLIEPVSAPSRRWFDQVGGVVMLSDEANLMHAHVGNGFDKLLKKIKPDLVVSDHGLAMAAINIAIPTIGIFDVDDPALPMMAHYYPQRVTVFPMNDNQTNLRSVKAAEALWQMKY